MALTRPMLKGMSLTEEQVSAIIDAHKETVDALKEQRDNYKADADKLAAVQKKLDEYENGKMWVKREDYDKLDKSFKDYKADVDSKAKLTAKQAAFAKLLTAENIPEKFHARIIKMTDFDGMEMDGDGIKDADKQRESIKQEWGEYVATTNVRGSNPETPPSSTTTLTKKDIYKRDMYGRYVMSAAERQKALAEHPDLMK